LLDLYLPVLASFPNMMAIVGRMMTGNMLSQSGI